MACTPLNCPGPLPWPAELADVLQVAVEDHDAVVIQTIGDQNSAVGEKSHVLRLAEMRAVRALHALFAQRLQQFASVVGENVDHVVGLVDHPDTVLRIIRADANAVRPRALGIGKEMIPLRPALAHLAIGVQRIQKVFLHHAAIRGAEHVDPEGAGKTRVAGGKRIGKPGFAALQDENAVGRFGQNAGVAPKGETWFGEGLVPVADHVVRAGAYRP